MEYFGAPGALGNWDGYFSLFSMKIQFMDKIAHQLIKKRIRRSLDNALLAFSTAINCISQSSSVDGSPWHLSSLSPVGWKLRKRLISRLFRLACFCHFQGQEWQLIDWSKQITNESMTKTLVSCSSKGNDKHKRW